MNVRDRPLHAQPPEALFSAAAASPTPAILYDFAAIRHVVARMRADIEWIPGALLNVALKSCHTPGVLALLAGLGLGCDLASVGELGLALAAGFTEMSCTGPAFARADFAALLAAGVVPDLDSVSQIELFGRDFPGRPVGLRVRIPLPPQHESQATFGADSRFGVAAADPEVHAALGRFGLRVTRLHVHTGQMTPAALLFKARYLLTVAAAFPGVATIDLGGGLFHFYADSRAAAAACARLADLLASWSSEQGRTLALRFEPGGALMGPCGYLVTEVRAVQDHPRFGRIVTVDASAWNLAPWHKPQIFVLPERDRPPLPGLVAGNTLYEGDFFGRDVLGRQHPLAFPPCEVGDRLVLSAFGAYTMTNARRFNRIPPPREFAIDGDAVLALGTEA